MYDVLLFIYFFIWVEEFIILCVNECEVDLEIICKVYNGFMLFLSKVIFKCFYVYIKFVMKVLCRFMLFLNL